LPPTSAGESIAVKAAGEITKKIIFCYVDDIILMDELCLKAAVQSMVKTEK
jgi:threonine dehydratase